MIYFIMPVSSDSAYAEKRRAVQRVLDHLDARGHFPMEGRQVEEDFSAGSVVEDMANAERIVADLALERPSCYFEVGLAQGAGLKVDLIAPSGTPIHQVAGRISVRRYSSPAEYEALVHRILGSDAA